MTTLSAAPPVIDAPINALRPGVVGGGVVRLERIAGRTAVTRLESRAPVKLLTPRPPGAAARVYASSLGGGLVAGDVLDLAIHACERTRGLLTTQASTKVYRSPDGRAACQRVSVRVDAEAALVILPDPVTCFTDAVFEQEQRLELAAGATLVLVDWMTAGRARCGERWAFSRYRSRIEIVREGGTLVADGFWLDRAHGPIDAPFRMGRFNCLAAAYVIGSGVDAAVDTIERMVGTEPVGRRAELLSAASRIDGGIVLRVAGDTAEAVGRALRRYLAIAADLLGESPWDRKW